MKVKVKAGIRAKRLATLRDSHNDGGDVITVVALLFPPSIHRLLNHICSQRGSRRDE